MIDNFLSNSFVFWNRFLNIFRLDRKFETNRSISPTVDIKSCKRSSIDNCPVKSKKSKNPNSITIYIPTINQIDPNDFSEKIKTYFQCSKCKTFEKSFKQCFNGHLFCEKCTGNNCVFCENCNSIISGNDLSICTLPSKTYSYLESICKFCKNRYYEEFLSIHQNDFCTKRNTNCDFHIFGCLWIGIADKKQNHVKYCQFQHLKIKQAYKLYQNYINKQKRILEIDNSLFRECILKVSQQNNGLRIVIKELTLTKFQTSSTNNKIQLIRFKSQMINLPFNSFVNHWFHMEFIIAIDNERNTKKFRYIIKSKTAVKAKLFYCLIDFNLDSIDIKNQLIDQLHWHEFKQGNEESNSNEIKINFTTNEICFDNSHCKFTVCFLSDDLNLEKSNIFQTEMENFISLFTTSMRSLNENTGSLNDSQTAIPTIINSTT